MKTMYQELVEIARSEPDHFIISHTGVISVLITLSMKSGSKTKQLHFQTDKRPMELAEVHQL